MGDILRRPVPSDQDIYKALPVDATIEDSNFPIDPDEARQRMNDHASGDYPGGSRNNHKQTRGERHMAQQSNQRRQLSAAPTYNLQGGFGQGETNGQWQRPYTTMEMATTTAQYSGFVTAAKHRETVVETEEPKMYEPTAIKDKRKRAGKDKDTSQQTIMQTFLRSNSTSTTAVVVDDEPAVTDRKSVV